MIVVRDVFRMKFGKAKDVKALMREFSKLMEPDEMKNSRVLFDLIGPSYTMVLEFTYQNLAELEESLGKSMSKKEWGEWYQKFIPLIESSYREIFTIFE
ncbi:MAG: NIPSNAP family protein [Bacteroidetes bacterium]|nr:NIPSNAP family protein [Bacteroidota bacterium]